MRGAGYPNVHDRIIPSASAMPASQTILHRRHSIRNQVHRPVLSGTHGKLHSVHVGGPNPVIQRSSSAFWRRDTPSFKNMAGTFLHMELHWDSCAALGLVH